MDSKLILASASPRRAEILAAVGIPFIVRVAEVEEVRRQDEAPEDYVKRLSQAKAEAVRTEPGETVLGADTIVVVPGETGQADVLEKPADASDAKRMLALLSGRAHQVITGICLLRGERVICDVETTTVHFLALDESEIDAYVASGEAAGKAGGYAIQGLAGKYIHRVEGCYFNVVGLPVSRVWRHMKG
ncbi:MAG: septum formation inhibitor Maf [Acidobacteriia bacterium]|nr:septum formation inhibitor Maf [Terriglobia bacterium]